MCGYESKYQKKSSLQFWTALLMLLLLLFLALFPKEMEVINAPL